VSISAVVAGLYEASLQRAHDRAEVWPHLELETFLTSNRAGVHVSEPRTHGCKRISDVHQDHAGFLPGRVAWRQHAPAPLE
jgi:hypothetical protein